MNVYLRLLCLLAVAVHGLTAARAFSQESEILVGHRAAGQLNVEIEFEQPLVLPVSIFPGISGYATGEMGVHSTILDDTNNDSFQLSTDADFRLILLAKDPGMEVWNDTGSGFLNIGELFYVGPPPFDTHPVWNLVNGTPGTSYSLTLKFRDLNDFYPDSEPFVLTFTAPPPKQYELKICRPDASHAILSWSTNAAGWRLESVDSVTATTWVTLTNEPGIAGTNFSMTISADQARRYFRLRGQ